MCVTLRDERFNYENSYVWILKYIATLHWIYPFQAILSNFGFGWQKSPPPSFLPFHQRSDSCHTCGIPMVPILQIHTQIPPIRISSLGYQLCQLFKLHIEKYRIQYHGTGGRPVGSLTTIHNSILAIPITLVDMALWNVSRLLYVYAYISWSAYIAKLLVILLEHLRSILYESMLKIKILENLAEKPPPPFCLFVSDLTRHTCGIPIVPTIQIYTQISLSEYLL